MSTLGVVEGKTFLITGAASGLGAGYAELFLQDKAKSVAILDIAVEKGNALAEKLNQLYPGKVVFVKCDLSSEEDIESAFNEVVNKFGTLDVVINNAGILNDSPRTWRKQCEVNYAGLVSFTLKAIKHMSIAEGGKGGTIINIASELALVKFPPVPIYSGTKAAVLHFSQALAADPFHEHTGIRVMSMCFGATDTPLLGEFNTTGYNEYANKLIVATHSDKFQKPESAVKGLVEMFKRGSNGSIWLSTHDRPPKDITSYYDSFYETLSKGLSLD